MAIFGNIGKPLDVRLAAELKTQSKPIRKGLACVVVTSALTAATVPILDRAVEAVQNKDPHALGWLSLVVVAIFVTKYWFTRGQTYYLSKAAALLTMSLRSRVFNKLQRLPVTYFNKTRSGLIQSIITNDVGLYQNAVMIIRDSIDGPIKAVGAFAMICWVQWKLAVVCGVFLPPIAFLIHRNGRKVKAAQTQVQQDQAELQAMTQEALYGVRVIKAFSAEDSVKAGYDQLSEASYKSQMRAAKRVASLRPLVELIGATGLAAVFFVCGWLAKTSDLRLAQIVSILYAFEVINQGFRTLGYVNSTFNQVQAGAERIYDEVLDQPEEVLDTPGALTITDFRGRIEFIDVSFTYPDGTQALKGVSFVIEPGTNLALVGTSGAGKSTIADLLLRFYTPTGGRILIDGMDLQQVAISWFRSQVGVVPQQTLLFAGSIEDNIKLGSPDSSPDDVKAAARDAYADAFIEQMPNGLNTLIGEGGVGLSGGERQRVAIARAIVRKPKILVLDEATSSLDAVSEKAVQEALDLAMEHRSTLFIAHRLTSAARADKILMLNRGEVIETGTHTQLIRRDGAYAGMYRAFSSGLLDESFA